MNTPRHSFTSTIFAKHIYVAGGISSDFIEVYDPIKDIFQSLPFLLPYSTAETTLASMGDSILIF